MQGIADLVICNAFFKRNYETQAWSMLTLFQDSVIVFLTI